MPARPTLAAAIALLLLSTAAHADAYKAEPGPAKVTTTDQDWRDEKRDRVLPVRLYVPEKLDAPAPVILISHGLGGTREAMGYAATHWCSHGYVVVALQHPGSDDAVWKEPDTTHEKVEAMRDAANVKNYLLRCDDVHFAIDHLEALAKPGEMLAGKVDLKKIGMAGHSFGAQTVQAMIGQRLGTPQRSAMPRTDARIIAAVAFSPGYRKADPAWAFADVKVPCFHFTGTKDAVGIVSDMTVEQRRMPFDNIHARGQHLITFEGGDHMVFSGSERPGADTSKYDRFHDLICEATTAFWDAELKGDPAAKKWMDNEMSDEVGEDGKVEAHGS